MQYVQSRKSRFRLRVNLQLLLIHWSEAELDNGVVVFFGQEVAVHQFDHVIDSISAAVFELADGLRPEGWKILLPNFVTIAG